ncbi:hypothetical protein [Herpetosiphon sp. NSE202]|uniref:hypothetical protein n=1 Tax=Herpetosiphon sp. NSE202 TaxID=3351349 RepID=UPI0036445171
MLEQAPILYQERLRLAVNCFYLRHWWFDPFADSEPTFEEKTAVVLFAEYPNQEYWRFVCIDVWQNRDWQQPLQHYVLYDEPIDAATFAEIRQTMIQHSVLALETSTQELTNASVNDLVLVRLDGQEHGYSWSAGPHPDPRNQAIEDLFHGPLGLEDYYIQQEQQLQRRRLPVAMRPLRRTKQISRAVWSRWY